MEGPPWTRAHRWTRSACTMPPLWAPLWTCTLPAHSSSCGGRPLIPRAGSPPPCSRCTPLAVPVMAHPSHPHADHYREQEAMPRPKARSRLGSTSALFGKSRLRTWVDVVEDGMADADAAAMAQAVAMSQAQAQPTTVALDRPQQSARCTGGPVCGGVQDRQLGVRWEATLVPILPLHCFFIDDSRTKHQCCCSHPCLHLLNRHRVQLHNSPPPRSRPRRKQGSCK